jgi:hypothetical protein
MIGQGQKRYHGYRDDLLQPAGIEGVEGGVTEQLVEI